MTTTSDFDQPNEKAQTMKTPPPTLLSAAHGSANLPRKPIDIAHEWLKKSRQEWNGHISTWTPEQMDNYHRDLGLLVEFVTDCWPNGVICMETPIETPMETPLFSFDRPRGRPGDAFNG